MDWIGWIAGQSPEAQPASAHASPPVAGAPVTGSDAPPAVVRVGIICVRTRRTAGMATYSPGLEHDANLYEHALQAADPACRTRFQVVRVAPEWDRSGVATAETLRALKDRLDVIIGLEELGSPDMIETLQELRLQSAASSQPMPIVIWVPNLEVTSDDRATTKNGKWRATLAALPTRLIDLIIAKMPRRADFMRCIRGVYEAYDAKLDDSQVVHVPHTCYVDESASRKKKYHQPRAAAVAAASASAAAAASGSSSDAMAQPALPPRFTDCSARTTVLHFAGSSPHKNTLECCRAGLEIVKRLNAREGRQRFTFTVMLCPWPSKRGEGPPLYAIGLEAYEAIQALAAAHPAEFKIIAGGFLSYPARRDLYARTRLAICASRAEGFGHYVLEAAQSGCLVVTTDGAPMSSLLTEPGTFALAAATKEEPQCYGFGYIVPASSITAAAMTLPLLESDGYCSDLIARCVQNETTTRQRFRAAMTQLKRRLSDMVAAARNTAVAPATLLPANSASPPPLPPMPTTAFSAAALESSLKKGVFKASQLVPHAVTAPPPAQPVTAATVMPPPGFHLPVAAVPAALPWPTSAPAPSLPSHYTAVSTAMNGHATHPPPMPHASNPGAFGAFASLFAAASSPQPSAVSTNYYAHTAQTQPSYYSSSVLPQYSPSPTPAQAAAPVPAPLAGGPTFHSGMSSLAALEARLKAHATPPISPSHAKPPPVPSPQPSPPMSPPTVLLPWPAPSY